MNTKILIIQGSPRRNGNTDLLASELRRGAEEAGNTVKKFAVRDLDIHGCHGCGACQKNGGKCVQKDGMQELYPEILAADVIVLASPVYFYSWTSQMKTFLDRTYAIMPLMKNKTFILLSACVATKPEWVSHMKTGFKNYVGSFRAGGVKAGPAIFAYDTDAAGEVKGRPALRQAYDLGKSL